MQQKQGQWNAARVLAALGRIGYDPVSAILDITDNSLSAGASQIKVIVNKAKATAIQPNHSRPRAVISSFDIIDNGVGMNEEELDNALTLGASEDYYIAGTLSKFGMGLKSAALSLGRRLEIISRSKSDFVTRKVILDYDVIKAAQGDYVYHLTEPSDADLEQLHSVCGAGSGTIVRISNIRNDSMPSITEVIEKLKIRAGIVYYYYLTGKAERDTPLSITVDGLDVDAFDPLFVSEISGDLNELDWDGISVKWITHNKPVQLDETRYAELEITQLPHPPSIEQSGKMSRKACHDHYMIDSESYGFYIYRNYRLISWPGDVPVKLMGVRTKASDLYAFRGRIMISSDADDLLNIDVTKNRIQFSELANQHLLPEIGDAIKKSKAAWKRRSDILKQILDVDATTVVNHAIDQAEKLSERDDRIDEEVVPPTEKKVLEERRKKAIIDKPATHEESKRLRETGERIQLVDSLHNNQLWERAHDPQEGMIVRINQSHRYYRDIILPQSDNPELLKALSILFYGLVRGEYDLIYKSDFDVKQVEQMLQEFRERVGGTLSETLRKIDVTKIFGE
ncbi:MAG: ATP-binding protein [Oscillochloridaceae bacterium umkhey_bin13]